MRRVVDLVDVFLPEDHNDHVDNWKEQVQLLKERISAYPEIEPLVSQLEDIVSKMRYVSEGDYYYADDHNLFVQAWRTKLEIDKEMLPGDSDVAQLESVVSQMREVKPGDFYYAMHHNLFADAWDIQERINAKLPRGAAIVLDKGDWSGMLQYAIDGAVVLVGVSIGTATPSDVLSLLNDREIKLHVLIDTQPYHKQYCGAFKDILYAVDHFTGAGSGSTTIYWDHDRSYFGTTDIETLYDYFPKNEDRAPDCTNWTEPNPDYYAYKYVGKGVVVELPYDGSWKSVDWLDKYIWWKPCKYPETWKATRVIVISGTETDTPAWHEYPTLDETLKAWAEQRGWRFLDLRTA